MESIYFTTEYVKLQQLMKLGNLVGQGSDAKALIKEGLVRLNGQVCTMRGKKVYDGDVMEFQGNKYLACKKDE